jgi:hypothetical protein
LRLLAGVDEVAGQRQLAAAAQREAVDRGDPHLGRGLDGVAQRPPASAKAWASAGDSAGHLGDVGAGDEGLVPAPVTRDHADRRGLSIELAAAAVSSAITADDSAFKRDPRGGW